MILGVRRTVGRSLEAAREKGFDTMLRVGGILVDSHILGEVKSKITSQGQLASKTGLFYERFCKSLGANSSSSIEVIRD